MSDTEEQVKKIVVEHLGIDESKVTPEARFKPIFSLTGPISTKPEKEAQFQ